MPTAIRVIDRPEDLSTAYVGLLRGDGAAVVVAAAGIDYAAAAHTHAATDLTTGTLAVARLPVLVGSGTGHAAGIVPDPGVVAGTTRFLREDAAWATVAGGTVTSVGLTVPAGLAVSGSPITTSGTLAITTALSGILKGTGSGFTTATAGTEYYAPGSVIQAADVPSLDAAKITTGTMATARLGTGTASGSTYLRGDLTWAAPTASVPDPLAVGTINSPAGTILAANATPPAAAATTQAGVGVTLTASAAAAGTVTAGAAAGGTVAIAAGAAARLTSGNASGGDITLTPGAGIGTGTTGNVVVAAGRLTVPNTDGTKTAPTVAIRGFSGATGLYTPATDQFGIAVNNTLIVASSAASWNFRGAMGINWSSGEPDAAGNDVGIRRSATGILEINSGAAGTYRQLRASGFASAYAARTAAYTLTQNDAIVTADASGGAFAVTLPSAAATLPGRSFTVKKTDGSANVVTLTRAGTDTIDGAATIDLTNQWKYVTVTTDGIASWFVAADPSGVVTSGLAVGAAVSGGGANRLLFENASQNLATTVNLSYDGNAFSVTATAGYSNNFTGMAIIYCNYSNSTFSGLTVDNYSFGGTNSYCLTLIGVGSSATPISRWRRTSSTNTIRDCAKIDALWATTTDASRKGRLTLSASDASATDREGLRVESDGTQPLVGFYGVPAVARAASPGTAAGTDAAVINAVITLLRNLGLCS